MHACICVCVFVCVAEMFDLKVKYDESDHVMVRATRAFTDKMGQMFGELLCLSLCHFVCLCVTLFVFV